MANSFKPDDKVITRQQGIDVEAIVRLIYNDEVQVRTPDGVLRWRTAKTVWFPVGAVPSAAAEEISAEPIDTATEAPVDSPAADPEPQTEEAVSAPDSDLAALETGEDNDSDSAAPVLARPDETQPEPAIQTQPLVDTHLEIAPCGVPETMAERKRNRKGGRRR